MEKQTLEMLGVSDTITALRKFAPDLYKKVQKGTNVAVNQLALLGKTYTPQTVPNLTNWSKMYAILYRNQRPFPRYFEDAVDYKIKVSQRNKGTLNQYGFNTNIKVVNNSAAGNILEFAGRGALPKRLNQSNNPHARQDFLIAMNNFYQIGAGRGRVLLRAAEKILPRVRKDILDLQYQTDRELQRRLNAIGKVG